MSINTFSINGFTTATQAGGNSFVPPCLYYGYFTLGKTSGDQSKSAAGATEVVYQYATICGIGDSFYRNSLLNSTIVLYTEAIFSNCAREKSYFGIFLYSS